MVPEEKMVSIGQRKSSYLAFIAIIILALLLGGTVTALIVFSLNTTAGCQKTQTKGEETSAEINLIYKGDQVKEKVNYDSSRNVAAFYNPDGSFRVEDYAKGINVLKLDESGQCFVIPVGTRKSEGQAIEHFLKGYNGVSVNVSNADSIDVQVIDGSIQDTSFLPQEAKDQCDSFKWLAVVNGEDSEQTRMKRALTCQFSCGIQWISVKGYTTSVYRCYILIHTCVNTK